MLCKKLFQHITAVSVLTGNDHFTDIILFSSFFEKLSHALGCFC